ncbi:MAG: 30S ribosomal protein S19 [Conexivisphaerales archaeon]
MEEFKYRGYSLEQLQKMTLKDMIPIVNADVRRKLKRGFTNGEKKLTEKLSKKDNVRTHLREAIILPQWVGKTINVHNGKEFVPVKISPRMVFHRLGEYVFTTKRVKHGSPGLMATRSSSYVPIK